MGAETRPAGFYGDVEQFLLFPEDLEAVHALEGMAAVRFQHLDSINSRARWSRVPSGWCKQSGAGPEGSAFPVISL